MSRAARGHATLQWREVHRGGKVFRKRYVAHASKGVTPRERVAARKAARRKPSPAQVRQHKAHIAKLKKRAALLKAQHARKLRLLKRAAQQRLERLKRRAAAQRASGKPNETTKRRMKDVRAQLRERVKQLRAQKRDRLLAIRESISARKREARPPRTARTPAAPTPKAPRRTKTPAPATPTPRTTTRLEPHYERGTGMHREVTDVSRHVGLTHNTPEYREAVAAIESVHRVHTPTRNVYTRTSNARVVEDGLYQSGSDRTGAADVATYYPNGLDRGRGAHITAIHELGHWQDMRVFSTTDGRWGSRSAESDPHHPLRPVMQARFNTQSMQDIVATSDGAGPDYLRGDRRWCEYACTSHETFARGYAQYIATRATHEGADELRAQLRRAQDEGEPHVWDDDEFAPVAHAFDNYFASQGLM